MVFIIFRKVDSFEHHLKKIAEEIKQQFAIYKEHKLEIETCSSFEEYHDMKRADKKFIIDYHNIFEYDYEDYHYALILVYLTKKNEEKTPVSYYVTISVEKNMRDQKTLLSLRYEDLKNAKEIFFKYKKIFNNDDDVLLLKTLEEDIKNNEWDLY